jgi:signal transduction histidine kinase
MANTMTREANRTPTQRILVAIGFGVVLVMSAVSVWLIRDFKSLGDRVDHAQTIITMVAQLRADMRRVESGQRGYLITQKARYLTDYNRAREAIPQSLDRIASAVEGDREQAENVAALKTVINGKLDELSRTLDLDLSGRHQEAVALVGTDLGLQLMIDIGARIDAISDLEHRYLGELRRSSNNIGIALFAVDLLGVVAIALLAYAAFVLFRRNTRELVESQAEEQALNTELEHRVAERTADLEEANSEIQRYAYVVTHDLRSPLVNIMGFTSELESLRDSVFRRLMPPTEEDAAPADPTPIADDRPLAELKGDFDEAIHFIKTSIAKMDGLIGAILKLSRAGRRELTIRPLDLEDLVEVIAADFRHRIREMGAELEIGPLPKIRSDRMSVEQILSNLIDNAVKYLRDDVPGRISITAQETPTTYRIAVADNGRGINPQDRERVFDLFRRAGKLDRPGEGIGLAHSRSLARRIGGTLAVAENPGGGSVFILTLSKLWMARQATATGGAPQ